MPEPPDLTIEILEQIRDEVALTRTDLGARIDQTNARLDETNSRLGAVETRVGAVETTLLDLAQQQRFVVRHLSTLTERDRRLEDDVDDLRSRVEVLERRMPSD